MSAVVLAATLWPVAPGVTPMARWCIVCGERGMADVIANMLLFVPLGLALGGLGWPWYRALLAAVLLSLGIEALQMTVIAGRDASPGDVLFDSLGAGLGLLVVWLRSARPLSWRRLVTAAAVGLPLAVTAATVMLFQRSLPQTGWWGQWAADLGYLEWYRGTIVSVKIAGTEVTSWRMRDSREVREALGRGDTVRVLAIAGANTPALAPIFSILDDYRREILLIGVDRTDLVVRQRLKAWDARLDQPDLRYRGAFSGVQSGDSLVLTFWRTDAPYRWCVTLNVLRNCALGWTVGRGWSMVSQLNAWPASVLSALDALWLGGLFLPLGLAARGGRRRWPLLVVLPVSLLLIPAGRMLPTPPLQWCAALAACALGMVIPRRLAPDFA